MSDEAFPNAEPLFQQAFAAADPAPLLLHLLKEHPTALAVRDLVVYYTDGVEEGPARGQSLASALATVANSAEAPAFGTGTTLSSLIDGELADHHFKELPHDSDVTEYGPKNTHLLNSLLSGLSLKHKLTSTSDMYHAIDRGLDAPNGSANSEVLVVGACIQLLLYGSVIVTEDAGTYRKRAEVVARKLKAQKVAGTVKNPHAIQVLELTMSHAEAGFQQENDRDDVWALLFPSKS